MWVPLAVKVFANVVLLVPDECDIVVANSRSNPFVVISPVNVVDEADAAAVLTVNAIKLQPTPPADVLV